MSLGILKNIAKKRMPGQTTSLPLLHHKIPTLNHQGEIFLFEEQENGKSQLGVTESLFEPLFQTTYLRLCHGSQLLLLWRVLMVSMGYSKADRAIRDVTLVS